MAGQLWDWSSSGHSVPPLVSRTTARRVCPGQSTTTKLFLLLIHCLLQLELHHHQLDHLLEEPHQQNSLSDVHHVIIYSLLMFLCYSLHPFIISAKCSRIPNYQTSKQYDSSTIYSQSSLQRLDLGS